MDSRCGHTLSVGGVKHRCQHPKKHNKTSGQHYYASPSYGYVVSWSDSDPDHDGDNDSAPSGSGDTDSDPKA